MTRARQQNNLILTESQQGLLASCLVIISTFVLLFTWTAAIAEAFFWLFSVLGVYILTLVGLVLLFTGRSKSKDLAGLMIFISVIEAVLSVFLLWTVFTFQM